MTKEYRTHKIYFDKLAELRNLFLPTQYAIKHVAGSLARGASVALGLTVAIMIFISIEFGRFVGGVWGTGTWGADLQTLFRGAGAVALTSFGSSVDVGYPGGLMNLSIHSGLLVLLSF